VFTRRKLDAETLEELETALITADVGVAATQHLLDDLSARWKRPAATPIRRRCSRRLRRPPAAARAAACRSGRRGRS
jgi:signal recognition particle GTPase